MFTGLVQALGTVRGVADGQGGRRLCVAEPALAPRLELGASVAVDGVCLTVVARAADTFEFEVGPETLAKTTLGNLIPGACVNLERALRVGDALGGHFVTGHADCVGTILTQTVTGEWLTVWFAFPPQFDALLVARGSIAVDGVSLTIVEDRSGKFSVMLIPHTRQNTTLGLKTPGSSVNLEFDLIAKHVQKLFQKPTTTVQDHA
jgi:riboflavin synthase